MNKYAALKGSELTFEAADASATVYEMDAQDAINEVLNPPTEENAEEAAE